ncbi:hypothetical protein, conserved, partial [Eimeria tenella]
AELTRGDASLERKIELSDKQASCLERALPLLQRFSPQSKRRNDLLQQLRTTVETHLSRMVPEAVEARKRLEVVLERIKEIQKETEEICKREIGEEAESD